MLILGEPGTGKSLVARLIHSLGPDPDRPFVTVEASAMADASATREAAESPPRAPATPPMDWSDTLSQARGGTLHLDEVSGLPTELQIHLLRACSPATPRRPPPPTPRPRATCGT